MFGVTLRLVTSTRSAAGTSGPGNDCVINPSIPTGIGATCDTCCCPEQVDPKIGKMLLMGSLFSCIEPVLTIAAGLAHRDPFILPMDKKEQADEVKRNFAATRCDQRAN